MDYRIRLPKAWRPDKRLIHPGTYRVPEDMKQEDAERALQEADAFKETPDADDSKTVTISKVPTGKNKSRGKAPDNKTSLG